MTSIKRQDDNGYIRLTYSVPEDEKTRQCVIPFRICSGIPFFFKQIEIQVPTPCFSFISRRLTGGQAVVFMCMCFMMLITGENVFHKKG